MIEILQIQGMDIVFGFKDLIVIGTGVIGITVHFITMKMKMASKEVADEKRFDGIEKSITNNVKSLNEGLMLASVKKNSMRAEITGLIEKKDTVTHKRIDAVRDDLKLHTSKTDAEFKELNKSMSEIKGMLMQLLNK